MNRSHLLGRLAVAASALAVCTLLTGCNSFRYHTEFDSGETRKLRIGGALLIPAENATDDENAGRAITELLATALYERGIPLYQTESIRRRIAAAKPSDDKGVYADIVKDSGATHLIFATVHEYRYKTDLDGDPAVGLTLRVVDARTGRTVWQGSAGNVGYAFASLTSSAEHTVRSLVANIPVAKTYRRLVPMIVYRQAAEDEYEYVTPEARDDDNGEIGPAGIR